MTTTEKILFAIDFVLLIAVLGLAVLSYLMLEWIRDLMEEGIKIYKRFIALQAQLQERKH